MPLKLDGTYGVSGVVGTASSAAVYGADVDSGIVFSGNQTLINSDGSTYVTVGAGTTNLLVSGNARVTGILTIGTSSVTLDGTNNQVNVGTGVTIHHTNGVQVGGNTVHSTGLTINQINIGTGASVSSPASNILTLGTNNAERVRINSSGNIGVGTNGPVATIDVVTNSTTEGLRVRGRSTDNIGSIYFYNNSASTSQGYIQARTAELRIDTDSSNPLTFYTGGSERVRVSAGGSLGVRESSPDLPLHVSGTQGYPASSGSIPTGFISVRAKSAGGTHGFHMGVAGVAPFGSWLQAQDANSLGTNYPLLLNPNGGSIGIGTINPQSTLHLNTSSGTAAIRLASAGVGSKVYTINGQIPGVSNGGFCIRNETDSRPELTINDVGDVQINTTSTGAQLEIDTDNNFAGGDVGCGIRLYHTITNLGSNNCLLGLNCATTNSGSYRMIQLNSGTTRSSFGDAEFIAYGNGTVNADGVFNANGADYAEYFEWSDGNVNDEDRRGISVVLDGNKIREALVGEDPIGVISGNPSMVGDAVWNKWNGKYLRDDYGSYVRDENGERQLNPAFNPNEEYVPREQRPEWDCVGLMGKLRIRKGQITGSRWIKMRNVSDTVEEWLVR